MSALSVPRLVNGPLEDPVLFWPFAHRRRGLLFDLGDLSALAPRDLLKVTHAFVSHTHMDHFIGFDRLLRLHLGRGSEIVVAGPAGFLGHLEGKFAAYSWDLMDRFAEGLRLHAIEVHAARRIERCYDGRLGFAAGEPREAPFSGLLVEEPAFRVEAAVLAHNIPCLAFAVSEPFRVRVLKTGLAARGLAPGRWLGALKEALYAGVAEETPIAAERADGRGGQVVSLGELRRDVVRIQPGRKIGYVSDVSDRPENREAIVRLCGGADLLFIEAAFLDREAALARRKHHLTARQAGEIAALAGARALRVMHLSPRYEGREADVEREALAAFEETRARLRPPSGTPGCVGRPPSAAGRPHGAGSP